MIQTSTKIPIRMNQLSDILEDRVQDFLPNGIAQIPPLKHEAQTLDVERLKTMIHSMKDQLDGMLRIVQGNTVRAHALVSDSAAVLETGERIIEGVFTGNNVLGQDGKEYTIPPNYASKSKLVEGDIMKLTITTAGKFIYKQIGPIERERIIGELTADESGQWSVVVESKPYKILTASVTFHKGTSGNQVAILVPAGGGATWGAVDNIIRS
jgi:hypothetical protein